MQRWHRVIGWAGLCVLFFGCRNNPQVAAHIQVLNAERRILEDRLYDLEYRYEQKLAELEDAQAELARLQGTPRSVPPRRAPPARSGTDRPGATTQPDAELDLDLSPPVVEPGIPDEPRIEMPDLSPPRSGASRNEAERRSARSASARLQPADPRITHIYLDPRQTGGVDLDQLPGDDGVSIVIEPRNANEDFVPLAGPVSVVVLDYAQQDPAEARLARWDLDAAQVDRLMKNSESDRGIHLLLPWQDRQPENSRLMVAVRYTTMDGRKLESRQDIFVTLPGQYSQRWTPRAAEERANLPPRPPASVARQPSGS